MKTFCYLAGISLLSGWVFARQGISGVPLRSAERSPHIAAADTRQLVTMPEPVQLLLRQDMRGHLVALNALIAALSAKQYSEVATIAEAQLGESSMGKYRGTGMGPGRFMPAAMQDIGRGMHKSASALARAAIANDGKTAFDQLQQVTQACVACHLSYRIR